MSSPAVIAENKKPAGKALWRPEETFWQRYSPHHEFPLATVSAISFFCLAIGALMLLWVLQAFAVDNDRDRPPGTDAVAILGPEGGGGDDGSGTGDSRRGDGGKTEAVDNKVAPSRPSTSPLEMTARLPDEIKADPFVPASPLPFQEPASDDKSFEALQNEATQTDLQQKIAAERVAAKKAERVASRAGGSGDGPGSRGSGGGRGGGYGTGVGRNVGAGTGNPFGRQATLQEIHANRWHFDFSGAAEHLPKLKAIGVTLVLAHPNGGFYKVVDLRKHPVDLVPVAPAQHKDEVTWKNDTPASVRGLAQALGINFIPLRVIMHLSAEREQKIAAVEHETMERQGRREETVRFTHFDFRLANGVYEPIVTKIE
jgi:hypothetical protein